MKFSRYNRFRFAKAFCVARQISLTNGDGEIRTLDPLLARQVLSQLSYTPMVWSPFQVFHVFILFSETEDLSSVSTGLKWTRTTDLTLIRRAL